MESSCCTETDRTIDAAAAVQVACTADEVEVGNEGWAVEDTGIGLRVETVLGEMGLVDMELASMELADSLDCTGSAASWSAPGQAEEQCRTALDMAPLVGVAVLVAAVRLSSVHSPAAIHDGAGPPRPRDVHRPFSYFA